MSRVEPRRGFAQERGGTGTTVVGLAPLSALLALLLFAWPDEGVAQAWAPEPGHGTVALGVQYMSGNKTFDRTGDVVGTRRLTQVSTPLWLHVGVHDRVAVTLSGELLRYGSHSGGPDSSGDVPAPGRTNVGVGDAELGVWTPIVQQRVRLVAGATVGLPLGRATNMAVDPDTGDLSGGGIPTGDGEWDVRPTVVGAATLTEPGAPIQGWVDASAGVWLRTEGFGHSLRWHVGLGITPAEGPTAYRLGLGVRVHGATLFDPNTPGPSTWTGLGDGVAWTAYGAELWGKPAERLTVAVGYESALNARNVIAAAPLSLKVGWDF